MFGAGGGGLVPVLPDEPLATVPEAERLSKSLIINLTHIDRVEAHQIMLANCTDPLPLPGGTHKSLLNRLHVIRTR